MTREQATQVVVRDQLANPNQGGRYVIEYQVDNGYEVIWHDPTGNRWTVSYTGTRRAWGLEGLLQ